MEAALPACYLSRAATQSNLDGGGISLVGDSSFPGSAVENLFTPPSSSSARVIKLQIRNGDRDSDIFVQIDGTATLATESLDYRVKLYGCDDDPTADPSTFDQISVSSDGSFVASTAGLRDGQISITLRGTVSYNSETGEYEYDSSAGNTADIVFINEGSSASNKYNVTVQSGTIMIKLMEIGSTSQRNGIAKIGYLGGVSDLAMTQGGTKWQTLTNNVETESSSGGFEYRDTRYASAPSNSFLSDIQSTDFSTDEFYLSNPSFSLDTSDFSCGTIPDVTVQIDMSSSTMQAIQDECEGFIPTNTRFCESDAIDDAETGFETNCSS